MLIRCSFALSVKMSALLYLPGILIILWRRRGIARTVVHVLMILVSQVVIGAPFLREYPREYLHQAFDLSRVFLFKWTVNWRFLGEEYFLHPTWSKALLLGHLTTLVMFAHTCWCVDNGGLLPLITRSLKNPLQPATSRPTDANCTFICPDYGGV